VEEGTGLGLPVVHGIVASHGGAIRVRSEPGKGSRFEVQVPLTSPEAPNAVPSR
jgi:signal transduction histidine kinase